MAKAASLPSAAVVLCGLALASCGPRPRVQAVPESLTEAAQVPGIPGARYRLDGDIKPFAVDMLGEYQRSLSQVLKNGTQDDALPPANLLALSGGGDAGAFSAGLLCGWTKRGTRPEFVFVTGISAGALVAPFAFLGPKYDRVLREVSTTVRPADVFHRRAFIHGLMSDGMSDSGPLAKLVARYVTEDILAEIAVEYGKGRVLLIGTTDLDSGRPVTWNMGAIAASKAPGSLALFRKILIASMSIPGAVAPVMIDVEAGGHRFQEMHVDGGVISQVFLYPARTLAEIYKVSGVPLKREMRVYAIRNGRLDPEWEETRRTTLGIGGRALSLLIQAQGVKDLDRISEVAFQDAADFNLAYIGSDFSAPHPVEFDTQYMTALFGYGFNLGSSGNPWRKSL